MYRYFVVFSFFSVALSARQQFRNDYTYEASVDGWLKLNRIPATWSEARLRCHYEGSVLASPLTIEMLTTMEEKMERGVLSVFTGISARNYSGVFFSIEGMPLDEIIVTWAPLEPDNKDAQEQCIAMYSNGTLADVSCDQPRPFLCYRSSENMPEINRCGTIDPEYTFKEETGHCYKFHRFGLTWPNAFMACAAEGGYLTVVNSPEEAQLLKQLMANNPSSTVMAYYRDYIGIGFFDWTAKGTKWMTVHGQNLKQAGYDSWNASNPNSVTANTLPWAKEFCGVIQCDGKLHDIACDYSIPFICEKDPMSLREVTQEQNSS